MMSSLLLRSKSPITASPGTGGSVGSVEFLWSTFVKEKNLITQITTIGQVVSRS